MKMHASHSFAESSSFSTADREERRRHRRLSLHCKIVLFANGVEILATTTQNVSIGGFYCLSPRPFSVGQTLDCTLTVPVEGAEFPDTSPVLLCRVAVVRSQAIPNSAEFGIGFRIDSYKVDAEQNGGARAFGRL